VEKGYKVGEILQAMLKYKKEGWSGEAVGNSVQLPVCLKTREQGHCLSCPCQQHDAGPAKQSMLMSAKNLAELHHLRLIYTPVICGS